ncbi:MAG: TonB-dependent receptor [Phycisphaerales bacterium]|nr:TonB-dependent receptor [Phycisphaerales bacterium]
MNKLRPVIAVVASSFCTVAAAQEGAAPTSKKFFDAEVNLSASYAFRSDVDGGGSVAVTRSMMSGWISREFTPDFRASLLVSTEVSWYDFNNATGLIAGTGKPFGQLSETDVSPGFACRINEQWTALSGLIFRVAGENDADFGDSFTWGGYVAAQYKPNKDFSVTFGVRANDRIEEDWRVLPAVALDWQVSQSVRLQVLPAVGGVGFRVTSEINDKVSFIIDGEYETREFRLNNEAPLALGVVRDSRALVGMGVIWTPCEKLQITARAGAVAYQEFRIDNSAGVQQVTANTDPTPYIFLGGQLTF